jgi:hypothetical protein
MEVEELTPRSAAKKYGPLIPAHVKIITQRPVASAGTNSASRSRSRSAERGNEQLGVPDKHEFYNANYENYKRIERSLKRKAKKMKKKAATRKTHH